MSVKISEGKIKMNIGSILIISAVVLSVASVIFMTKDSVPNEKSILAGRRIYYISSILIIIASMILMSAFITNDFQYHYVYANSSRNMPLLYLISGFWAGSEGSFLLWLLLLNLTGLAVIKSKDKNENIIMTVIIITQIFILIMITINSPFEFIWKKFPNELQPGQIPPDGSGMNPLLMDPWMIAHPPILFLGYAAATVPFAFAIAALINNNFTDWVKSSYKWLLFSMISLGIGIFMGGYWAYKVLGWGGFWGWDPVENSSLIPWLVSVALMHGMLLQKRKGALPKTNIALAVIYFVLVFYSTFLTRSGVLSNFSVHSFGESGTSPYLIGFMLITLFSGFFLLIKKFNTIKGESLGQEILSWANLTLFGMLTVIIYAAVILIGTSMPIISGIFLTNQTSVTSNFYNGISVPFGVLILTLMIMATMASRGLLAIFKNKLILLFIILSAAAGILFNLNHTDQIQPFIISVIAFFIIFVYLSDIIKFKFISVGSSRLTHIGIAVMAIGIIASGFHSSSIQKKLFKDIEEKAGTVNLTFKNFNEKSRSTLSFILKDGNSQSSFETDYYIDQKTHSLYREPHIEYGFFKDIYITPEQYESGEKSLTNLIIAKGEKKFLGNDMFVYVDMDSSGMRSEEPSLFVNLTVNGNKLSPGIKIVKEKRISVKPVIPGTDREVSLVEIDADSKKVLLHVTPGRDTLIPPDSVMVDVSFKRFIWAVWLGTILISAGGIAAVVSNRKKK